MTAPSLPAGSVFVVSNLRATTVRSDGHLPVSEQRGPVSRAGGKHFAPGARLYVAVPDSAWPEQVRVVGRHRGGGRLVEVYVRMRDLCRTRVRRIHDPRILAHFGFNGGYGWVHETEAAAEKWALRLELEIVAAVARQPEVSS